MKTLKTLFLFLALVSAGNSFGQTKEETIAWLKEKIEKYYSNPNKRNGEAVSEFSVESILACQIVVVYTESYYGKIRETIPTDIMSVDKLVGRLVFNSDKIKTEFLEGPYEKGKTTYYRGSWFSLINGEDNFYERFEKAFKHLATFCEKKKETF